MGAKKHTTQRSSFAEKDVGCNFPKRQKLDFLKRFQKTYWLDNEARADDKTALMVKYWNLRDKGGPGGEIFGNAVDDPALIFCFLLKA